MGTCIQIDNFIALLTWCVVTKCTYQVPHFLKLSIVISFDRLIANIHRSGLHKVGGGRSQFSFCYRCAAQRAKQRGL